MDTSTIEIGKAWGLVVPTGDSFLMSLPFGASIPVFIAVKGLEEEPDDDVVGHRMDGNYSRNDTGPGNIYARAMHGSDTEVVRVSLTTWTD